MNLRDNEGAVRGVLWSSRGAWLTLANATMLTANTPPSPIDGTTHIHRDRVLFLQELP